MNEEQFSGMIREIIVALAALLVSFNVFPETNTDVLVASAVALAVGIWGIVAKPEGSAAMASFARKALAAIPPVLALYNLVTVDQAASMTAVIFAGTAAWSMKANR